MRAASSLELQRLGRAGLRRGHDVRALVGQLRHAALLPQDVERPVAADGEQPLRQPAIDVRTVLDAEAKESLLHDVARRVVVAQQPGGVARERPLEAVDRLADELAVGVARHHAHLDPPNRAPDRRWSGVITGRAKVS